MVYYVPFICQVNPIVLWTEHVGHVDSDILEFYLLKIDFNKSHLDIVGPGFGLITLGHIL